MDESTSTLTADKPDIVALTTEVVAAYVANNSVPVAELPALLTGVHAAIAGLGGTPAAAKPEAEKLTSAQIRKSITPDALISFIDGKPYKTLKRHLSGNGLAIEEYRTRYGLPADYPTVAASYSEQRSKLALALGLGQQRRNAAAKAAVVGETIAEEPKARGRKKAAEPAATSVEKPVRARKKAAAVA